MAGVTAIPEVKAKEAVAFPTHLIHSSSPLLSPGYLSLSKEAKVDVQEVELLLQHVANGEQKEAEVLIKRRPELLLRKGDVRDLSKREFKEISAFQYAVWALDWHMWRMLLKYLAQEEAAIQWKELDTRGTAHGKQASWQGLIDAYNVYVRNWDKNVWVHQVGGAQFLLPAHVVNEYCHPTLPFYPRRADSATAELPRTRIVDGQDWYSEALGVGVKVALYRGSIEKPYKASGLEAMGWGLTLGLTQIKRVPPHMDVEIMASLLEIRQRQRAELGKTLFAVLKRHQEVSEVLCRHGLPTVLVRIVSEYDRSSVCDTEVSETSRVAKVRLSTPLRDVPPENEPKPNPRRQRYLKCC